MPGFPYSLQLVGHERADNLSIQVHLGKARRGRQHGMDGDIPLFVPIARSPIPFLLALQDPDLGLG